MAEGTIKIKEMEELTELTDNDYFVVDNLQSGVPTKKYKATRVIQMIENVADEIEEKITPSIDTALAVGSASGNIASFSDGSNLPMPKLQVGVEPQQDLHGYDNPWVGGSGKNKSEKKITEFSYSNNSGGSSSVSGDILTVTITSTNNSGVYSFLSFVESFTGKCSYSVDVKASTSASALIGMTNAGRKSVDLTTNWQRVKFEDVTFDGQGKILCIYSQGTANTIQLKDFMFETGSTAHDYEPYSNICPIIGHTEANVVVSPTTDAEDGQTYTIQFKDGDNPLTVYGGTLDLVNGKLVVDRVTYNVTSVSRNNATSYYHIISGEVAKVNNFETVISDKLPTAKDSASVGIFINDRAVIRINTPNEYASAGDMLTAYGGSIQVVYELATPITYQLTPTQVKSLLGTNKIWADTGEIIDCEYKRDATAIINSLIARIEALENQ